jgi:hypothetical protein
MIDGDRKMLSYQEVEEDIVQFFQQFRARHQKNQETVLNFVDRKSADSALLLSRIDALSRR